MAGLLPSGPPSMAALQPSSLWPSASSPLPSAGLPSAPWPMAAQPLSNPPPLAAPPHQPVEGCLEAGPPRWAARALAHHALVGRMAARQLPARWLPARRGVGRRAMRAAAGTAAQRQRVGLQEGRPHPKRSAALRLGQQGLIRRRRAAEVTRRSQVARSEVERCPRRQLAALRRGPRRGECTTLAVRCRHRLRAYANRARGTCTCRMRSRTARLRSSTDGGIHGSAK
mmetsp:Transcript_55463/g.110173  ORF Transcript_55463/g.110173 Transcript_55463/m.110173 type:complete len:227 (-) Transcript_55463:719-1399(-)